jgi:hypothetical protein
VNLRKDHYHTDPRSLPLRIRLAVEYSNAVPRAAVRRLAGLLLCAASKLIFAAA